MALLCLLAIRGEARRDEVVDLLWRGVEEDRARNAFRQALHRLRGAIGDDLLPQDRERLRLVRSDRLVVDLAQFDAAAGAGRLEEAIASYRGDFLATTTLGEPPFDMWVEQERARLRGRFRKVLEDAVASAAAGGRWTEAIGHARRLMVVAPFEATAAQLAATTLVSAGRRAEARELLQRFSTTLQSELGLPLPTELQAMLGRIERQSEKHVDAPGAAPVAIASLPFVGREAVLSQLVTLARTAGEDAGGLALIEGDAGLGKTRLVRELASHVKSIGRFTVLTGRERAAGASLPYGIFGEALRPLVRAPGIVGASRHLLAEAARLLPELRDEIDLPAVTDVEDDAARLRFFEGVAALIDAAAFEQPIVLTLEDLQHLTPSSLDLLSYLAARLAGSAVTFVLSVRSAEAPPAVLARLRALSAPTSAGSPPHGARAHRILLESLSLGDAHGAASAVAKAAGIGAAVVDRVAQRADGNPGRLLELLRRAASGDDVATLPVSVRELVTDRLQGCSSAQKRLTIALALIGRPVPPSVAAAAAHLPDAAASDAIDSLELLGLIERDGGEVVLPEVVARVALDGAGEATRTFLASWVAEALAATRAASAAELARLYATAGESRQAFEQSRRAAFGALTMGAVAEGMQLLHAARTFASTAPEHAEIESFLTSLGSGRRQIAAPAARVEERTTDAEGVVRSSADDRIGSHTPFPRRDEATVAAQPQTGSVAGWERWFPNWRLLLGGAVATLLVSAAVLALRPPAIQAARRDAPDTLVVTDGESGRTIRYAVGGITQGFTVSERRLAPPRNPAWIDSLVRPWVGPITGPHSNKVAVTRVTPQGSEVYVISTDRRDTLRLAPRAGGGDAQPLGWSPDGRWLLVSSTRTLADGTFDTDLFALATNASGTRIAIDTTARRAIVEAAWSPDGSRIAWVARVGSERQLEVFASDADGSSVVNLSRHPADDHHIAWSPAGELLAFTSVRDGNAELYAASLRESRLWRLTFEPSQDDGAAFSGDGRLVAFESTRGGDAGVYVMPALGGEPTRIGDRTATALSVARWQGTRSRYVDEVRVRVADRMAQGDTASVTLVALDQFEEPMTIRAAEWAVLDSAFLRLERSDESNGVGPRLIARRPGLARIVGHVGRWRFDTAFVHVGDQPVALIGSTSPRAFWRLLGHPLPELGPEDGSIRIRADREWDSGVLSRSLVPLLPGLSLSAVLEIPVGVARDPATSLAVSLVAPEDSATIDATAPQFLRYVTFSWNADAGRFVYAVGREVHTEPAAMTAPGQSALLRIRIEQDSTVSFSVAGQQRWRSTLRAIGAGQESKAHIWIAGRASDDRVRVGQVRLVLAPGARNADP